MATNPVSDRFGIVPPDSGFSVVVTNGVRYEKFRISATPASQNLLTSQEAWNLISVSYTVNVAGTDASAVSGMLKKCTGTQAPSAGTDLLSAGIDLKSTANTTVSGTLTGTAASLSFGASDRLAFVPTGVTTAVDGYFTIGYQKVVT